MHAGGERPPIGGWGIRGYIAAGAIMAHYWGFKPAVLIRGTEVQEEIEFLDQPFAVLFNILVFINAVGPELAQIAIVESEGRAGFYEKAVPAAFSVLPSGSTVTTPCICMTMDIYTMRGLTSLPPLIRSM